ncbi:AraC family transcriptional regulator of adaptative response / DNA-3-methyladenine glycosylase II [Kribbella italica]|uniref:AraC family transcriptional regulator of adaptative response / DNA-3-methyladenine glycosylase II n=1 Tax=Kribbella italica TaxID=1540520 RepID=A0A7W9JH86_9ACTN|nr:AraC family transcriptional regulator of adaptative response / DNA-3-methyladenine glycosylase II [Kribbella italica]
MDARAPEMVCRAVQLIIDGVLDEGTEVALGERLAVSPRHLRRMFRDHLGVTPDQLARSRRAHFARRLLDDSDLSVADIAFASGFGSLRQFNREMRQVFRAAPRELRDRRRRADRLTADGGLVMRLPYQPPYDWDAMLEYFAARAIPGVESVADSTYRRTIALDGGPGLLELTAGTGDHLILRAHLPYWEGLIHVVERAARMVGLDTAPAEALGLDAAPAEGLALDPVLGPRVRRRPGLRVPGAWGPLEAAVQSVLAQGNSLDDARAEAGELVARYGHPVPGLPDGLTHLFPSAEALDTTGLPQAIAQACLANPAFLDQPLDALIANLTSIPGLTADTAHTIALRLGHQEAFPPSLYDDRARWHPHQALAATYLTT